MTDEIPCPECEGTGEERIGPLRLQCRFCHGRRVVGGVYEPAEGGHQRADGYRLPEEGEEYDPAVHGPLPAAWEHPIAEETGICGYCMGSGKVVDLGIRAFGDDARQVVEHPCPACARKGA